MPTTNNGLTTTTAASPPPLADAVTGPVTESTADHVTATVDMPPHDTPGTIRDREGLPPEAVILYPASSAPMRAPEGAWALLIQAVEVAAEVGAEGKAALRLLAGSWLADRAPAGLCDGDFVVRFSPVTEDSFDGGISGTVAVEAYLVLARRGRWEILATWSHLGPNWPRVIAPTVAAVMGLYTDLVDLTARHDATRPFTSPLIPSAMNHLTRLLDAGLVTAQEEFLWERNRGRMRHIARVRPDGALALADGRVFATPSAAASTLSGYPRNGWDLFHRIGDGTTLGQLRTELHRQHHASC
jgi:DNA-binding transcriptional ArsR family regulator